MTLTTKNLNEIKIHLKVVFIYLAYLILIGYGSYELLGGFWMYVLTTTIGHSLIIPLFYVRTFYIIPYYFNKQIIKFIIRLVVELLAFGLGRYLINFTILPFLGASNRYLDDSDSFFFSTLWVYAQWFGYSLGYFYARKSIEQEKELRILQVEKAEAEMRFLKAQINPHFMFNTLNLINSKVMKASKSASDIILQLSDMFRYMTGKDSQNDLVPLHEEVGFVFNYVDMLNKRNSYSMAVAIDQEGDFSKYEITPMVLITILENAFKHGDVFDHDFPLIITMIIDENNLFTFSTANKIKVEEQKGGDTGIGISNITRRLTVVHGSAFTLNSYLGDQQEYICKLTIQY
jgi:two-component system, LytTR family, sensor kinase